MKWFGLLALLVGCGQGEAPPVRRDVVATPPSPSETAKPTPEAAPYQTPEVFRYWPLAKPFVARAAQWKRREPVSQGLGAWEDGAFSPGADPLRDERERPALRAQSDREDERQRREQRLRVKDLGFISVGGQSVQARWTIRTWGTNEAVQTLELYAAGERTPQFVAEAESNATNPEGLWGWGTGEPFRDLNRDGTADFAFETNAYRDTYVQIWLSQPDGTFAPIAGEWEIVEHIAPVFDGTRTFSHQQYRNGDWRSTAYDFSAGTEPLYTRLYGIDARVPPNRDGLLYYVYEGSRISTLKACRSRLLTPDQTVRARDIPQGDVMAADWWREGVSDVRVHGMEEYERRVALMTSRLESVALLGWTRTHPTHAPELPHGRNASCIAGLRDRALASQIYFR